MITLTDNAATKVKQLIDAEGEEGLALRVEVRPGGCSGYSYEMYFDTDVAADDIRNTYGDVDVVVDPTSAQLLQGATLDYKDGLEAGFAITNPNAELLRLRSVLQLSEAAGASPPAARSGCSAVTPRGRAARPTLPGPP